MEATDSDGRALLCQCLAAVSMADGDLDSREIATQLTIIEQITGILPSADEIVAASIDMGEWVDFLPGLESKRDQMADGFRDQIIKASILVGRADDSMQDAEYERIRSIATALGYTAAELEDRFNIIR